ncbi:MAG: DNA recombination protein RmuC [Planctomycetes bacterium]|nr:DNA recombination protein RmuC [Planctomycetota bacterium]
MQQTVEESAQLRKQLLEEANARVKAEAQLVEALQRLAEEKKLLEDSKTALTDTFKALAGDSLNAATAAFLRLAQETFDKALTEAKGDLGKRHEAIQGLVKPLSEALAKFDEQVRQIEKQRQEAYASLAEQVKQLSSGQQQLQKETANLVTALRRPQVRGRWGELTLRRVVELAGMSEHCDFVEQATASSEEGRVRPDLLVRLPAGREIIVDAKVPLEAYLEAAAADSEEARQAALARHAAQVRDHMQSLASKAYWSQFDKAPEIVVMFIPGESFFSAALEADASLLEDGMQQRVVLATPTTLIALLRAVAYGWRQQQIAQNAQEISNLGKQLYERMRTLAESLDGIGKNLEKATESYNKAVGSLEGRVLPAARRFKELGVTTADDKDIPTLTPLEKKPRALSAPEARGETST